MEGGRERGSEREKITVTRDIKGQIRSRSDQVSSKLGPRVPREVRSGEDGEPACIFPLLFFFFFLFSFFFRLACRCTLDLFFLRQK